MSLRRLLTSSDTANPIVGIVLAILTGFLFATLDTGAKFLSQELPVPTVIWGRYVFHVLALLIIMTGPRFITLFRVRRPGLVIVRGLLLGLSTVFFFTAISQMPLADANALGFVTPLIVVALSIPLLKEKVGPRRWAAVLIGFAGVLIIIRPGFQEIGLPYILVLCACVTMAFFSILTRILGATEQPVAMLFYGGVVGTIMGTAGVVFMPGGWETPELWHWPILMVIGLLGGGSHFILIYAYRHAPVSTLAPFTYVQIVWTTSYGLLVFGDFPDIMTFVGAGVIIASGLYVLFREARIREKT